MICMKCGRKNPENANFCVFCGADLQAKKFATPPSQKGFDGPWRPQDMSAEYQPELQSRPPQKKRGRLLVAILVSVIVLIGLGIGAFFGFHAYQENRFYEQLSLGEKYLRELQYDEAVVALQTAIEIDPKKPEPYVLLADVYIAQEKFEEAKDVLDTGYEATGGAEEIKEKQEELENILGEGKDQNSRPDDGENSTDGDSSNTGPSNGEQEEPIMPSEAVEYRGDTYYWEYTDKSFEKEGVMGNFAHVAAAENNLVRRSPEGKKEVVYTGQGYGKILVLQDRVYFTEPASGSEGSQVCSVNLQGDDLQKMDGSLLAGDPASGTLLLYLDGEGIQTVNAEGDHNTLADGTFVGLEKDRVFYSTNDPETASAELFAIGLDGSDARSLATFSTAEWVNMGAPAFAIQIVDDTVYFFYGVYGGTGMFLQEGALYRVNLDGSGLEKLTDTYLSSFYVYEEEGTPMLLYNQDANLAGSGGYPGAETPTGNAVCYCMNLDTGETSSVSKPVGPVGKVFSDGEGNYWVYPDLSGTPVSVISAEEGYSKGSLGTSADGEEISYIDTVFLSGDRAYFTVIQAERSRELDVGWRSGFRRISSALYCKDIHTGEVELLYTY